MILRQNVEQRRATETVRFSAFSLCSLPLSLSVSFYLEQTFPTSTAAAAAASFSNHPQTEQHEETELSSCRRKARPYTERHMSDAIDVVLFLYLSTPVTKPTDNYARTENSTRTKKKRNDRRRRKKYHRERTQGRKKRTKGQPPSRSYVRRHYIRFISRIDRQEIIIVDKCRPSSTTSIANKLDKKEAARRHGRAYKPLWDDQILIVIVERGKSFCSARYRP